MPEVTSTLTLGFKCPSIGYCRQIGSQQQHLVNSTLNRRAGEGLAYTDTPHFGELGSCNLWGHHPVAMQGGAMKEILEEFEKKRPELVIEWNDTQTEARGWLVINSLKGGAAGGGTRMRVGIDV